MGRQRKPEADYAPIYCPGCGKEIYQLVSLQIKCPVGWRNLSKAGIRSPKVQVQAAFWDEATWFCDCGLVLEFAESRRKAQLKGAIRRRPSVKWGPRIRHTKFASEEK